MTGPVSAAWIFALRSNLVLVQKHQRPVREHQRRPRASEQAGVPECVPPSPMPCRSITSTKKTATGELLYAVAPADRGLTALAGLWENSRSPAGEWMRSFAIITTKPNELCAELHNGIPMVSAPEAWPVWLAEEAADQSQLKALLAPYPSDRMTCWSVSAGWQRQE
jgi:hypothetical protein